MQQGIYVVRRNGDVINLFPEAVEPATLKAMPSVELDTFNTLLINTSKRVTSLRDGWGDGPISEAPPENFRDYDFGLYYVDSDGDVWDIASLDQPRMSAAETAEMVTMHRHGHRHWNLAIDELIGGNGR